MTAPAPIAPPSAEAAETAASGRDWRRTAALAGGGLAALLGAAVVLGWHLRIVPLTHLRPHFRPMFYLSAVGFLLTGIALIALRLELRLVARACAGLAALMGLVRSLEYLAGIRSGLDGVAIGVGGPEAQGQMAPLTAASFVLVNVALLAASRAPGRRRRPAFEGLAGAVVFGIGSIGVLGYLLGNPAYAWGPLTGMSLHSAAGLVVLGLSTLFVAWHGTGRKTLPDWTPLLALVACLAATVSLWRAVISNEDASFRTALRLHADSLAAAAETQFKEQVLVLDRFARRLQSIPTMPRAAWEEDARFALLQYPGIRQVAWTDDALRVRWAMPNRGGLEEVREDRPSDARVRESAVRALRTDSFAVSDLLTLPDGGVGIGLCIPTAPVGAGPGLLVALMRLDLLLDAVWSGEIAEGFAVSVSDGTRDVYQRGLQPQIVPEASHRETLEFLGVELRLRAWPSPILVRSRSRIPTVALVLGLAVSALIALLLHLAMRAKLRAGQAESARREIEERSRAQERTAAALAESEARFRAMSEASPIGVFLTDARGEAVYVNRAIAEITGRLPEEILGTGWIRGIHPEDSGRVQSEWGAAVRRRADLTISYRLLRPDGRLIWVEGAAAPIHSEGAESGYVGVLRDITEARQARTALEERARLAAFAAEVGAALTTVADLKVALQRCAESMVQRLEGAMSSIWTLDGDALELQASAWVGAPLLVPEARIPVGMYRIGRIARDRKPALLDLTEVSESERDADWARRDGMVAFAGYPLVVGQGLVGVIGLYAKQPLNATTLDAMGAVADELALGIARLGATAALQSSEARFRAISEASPLGLLVADPAGACVYVNRRYREITGLTDAQASGQGWLQVIHPDDRDGVLARWHEASRAGEPFDSTFRIRLPNGGTAWLNARSAAIRADARATGHLFVIEDVTERRRAAEEIEERTRLAVFGSVVGTALTKAETLAAATERCAEAIVSHLSGAMASIWIFDENAQALELSGTAWQGRPLLPPSARVPLGKHHVGSIASERKPALVDLAGSRSEADGEWASREGIRALAGYPLVVGDRLVGVAAIYSGRPLTDATLHALSSVADEMALGIDRFRGADRLRVSEARTRLIIDNMMGGLITTDRHARIESVNPAAEKIFGYRAEELVGQSLATLLPPDESRDVESFFEKAGRQALGRITEWDVRRRDGEVFPIELALFGFQTPDQQWHLAGNVRDISERREIDRMKREFVSTVSHELRTPLTSIRGSLGLLAGGVLGALPHEAKEAVTVAERNVVRLVGLINDILDLERFDTGRTELQVESVPASAVLERSVAAVRAFADQEGIGLEPRETSAVVSGDPDRLVQVVVNLLSNAIKFSPPGSAVTLSAERAGDQVEFRVADRGRGVPADMREKIFERFRQVESSDARSKGGTGLGLAICKAIVERHNGTIGVESEEGRGSAFWFRVAAAGPAPAAAPDAAALAVPSANGDDVLLVEDDETLLAVLARQLEGAGLSVRRATTGSRAVALALERRPGLLVLDLRLPDMDGFAVVDRLRAARLGDVPLLVHTERDVGPGDRRRLALGPSRFLTKSRSSDEDFLAAALALIGRAAAAKTA